MENIQLEFGGYSNFLVELLAEKSSGKKEAGITGCKKPDFMIGKKKREYLDCLDQFTKQGDAAKAQAASLQAENDQLKSDAANAASAKDTSKETSQSTTNKKPKAKNIFRDANESWNCRSSCWWIDRFVSCG